MTNTYKAVSEYGRAIFGEHVFDGDFDAGEEKDLVGAGHLEIEPRKYRILSDNFSGGEMGSDVMAAYPMEIEAALLQGNHLRRADDKPAAKKTAEKKD